MACVARTRRLLWCVCLALCLIKAAPVFAEPPAGVPGALGAEALAAAALQAMPPAPPAGRSAWRLPARETSEERPAALTPLYVSFAALQALDAHTTLSGVRSGRTETNPVMAPLAGEPALLIGAKSAASVGTIVVAERLWRRHRTAAIVLMIAVNAAHAVTVAHNYRQLRR